jgi:hypothetical protein
VRKDETRILSSPWLKLYKDHAIQLPNWKESHWKKKEGWSWSVWSMEEWFMIDLVQKQIR